MRARNLTKPATDAGFTMTEILVVLLVIGILAGIAIPTLLIQRQRAVDVGAKSEAASAERAMVIYGQDNDTYACGDSAQCATAMKGIDSSVGGFGLSFSDSGGAGDPAHRSYRVTTVGGQNRTFWVDRAAGDTPDSGCDLNGAPDNGGCHVAAGATSGGW